MITIDIEIKPRNQLKELYDKIHSKLEDLMFLIILKVPNRFVPTFFMQWLDKHTKKRLCELEQDIIRQRWRKVQLEKAAQEIRSRNHPIDKAQEED